MITQATSEGAVTGDVRLWLRAEGLIVLALSLLLYSRLSSHWWLFAILLFVPDLCMLAYLINTKIGSLSYNIVHSYLVPLILAIAAIGTKRPDLIALLCIWTAHIGLDRMLGFGLKYPSSFSHTHLGSPVNAQDKTSR